MSVTSELQREEAASSTAAKTSASPSPAPPNILLVTTMGWISTARLAMALTESGCRVEIVCRKSHPVRLTDVIERWFEFKPLRSLRSVEKAILFSDPDLIVSCDEPALALLHRIHARALALPEDRTLAALIERSVGNPDHFQTALARSQMIDLARQEGIGTPSTRQVNSVDEIPRCIQELGVPLVLKSDTSAGGTGVRVAHTPQDAAKQWKLLRGPTSPLRTVNRAIRDRDWTPFLRFLRQEKRVVTAQQYIANKPLPMAATTESGSIRPGRKPRDTTKEGNMVALCWRGEVLACICMEVVETWRANGPSSVLRVIEQPEMVSAARKIARRLEFCGFCGFDFIFESVTDRPLLLEMNARPTQISHLALGAGRDLTSALSCVLQNVPLQERPTMTGKDLIALFPQEWQRDPSSAMLRAAYHDAPRSQPELLRLGYRVRPNRRSSEPRELLGRMWAFYTGQDLY